MMFAPRISRRGDYYFAELSLAPGPQQIATPGDNKHDTLYGREWALELQRDRTLHLYQEQADGDWLEVTEGLPGAFDAPLPVTARRISHVFDQSARIILAYEDEGIVKLTRWDATENQYLQNVSFAGIDPLLMVDAAFTYSVPGSDVIMFYRKTTAPETVFYRLQSEVYATERILYAHSEPVILDRATNLLYRYQLLIANATGDQLANVLLSERYPIPVRDAQQVTAGAPQAGTYRLVVLSRQVAATPMTAAAQAPQAGTYRLVIVTRDAGVVGMTAAAQPPQAGTYRLVIITRDTGVVGMTTAAQAPQAGTYRSVIETVTVDRNAISVGATAPIGGTYAIA